jgi:D-alanyl-D-alanine carboxypeptidase
MDIRIIFLLAVVLVGAGLYVLATHPPATPRQLKGRPELELYLNALVQSGNPPGLSLAVVKDGRLVYNRAFGEEDGPHNKPATVDTVYHWWSMTKIPTLFAIMQLVEQGKLELDQPVAQVLPWFEVIPLSSGSPVISIRHLLQHTSGLPDSMPSMIGWVHYDNATRDQTKLTRQHLARFNRLKTEPGGRAAYSNFNYMVLGAVIEAVTGRSYERYIADNILQPLSMAQTGFVVTGAMAAHEASGTLPLVHMYTLVLPTILDVTALIRKRQGKLFWLKRVYVDATPPTGLIGPAADVARLMLAYLNAGELDGARILRPETVSRLNEIEPKNGHGLGWFMGATFGRRYLEHAGGGPGFATDMRLYPAEKLGVAILANGTDLDRYGLQELLAKLEW